MAEEQEAQEQEVDESLMSANDMIAQEIEKTSDAVQQEGEGKEGSPEAAAGKEEAPAGEEGEEQESPSRLFQAYSGDTESEDYEALEELTVKFKANGEEQSLTMEELVREAQKKEGLSSALATRTKQRDETLTRAQDLEAKLEEAAGNGDLLLKVLQDPKAYEELKAKFLEAGGSATPAEAADPKAAAATAEAAETARMETGRGVVEEHILPFSEKLSELYGADAQEIAQEIIGLAGQHPQEFFNDEVLAEIMNVQIPQMLQDAGFVLKEGGSDLLFDASVISGSNTNGAGKTYGIQKKGSDPRGQTEQESKLVNRVAELEKLLKGKGQESSEDPGEELESVSGGPSEAAGNNSKGKDAELNLDGKESVADIMSALHDFGE